MRKSWKYGIAVSIIAALMGCTLVQCGRPPAQEPPRFTAATEVVQAWNARLLDLTWNSEGYRPPVTARLFAYTGIGAWECSAPALENARSLQKEWPSLSLPQWEGRPDQLVLPLALNQMYNYLAAAFFPHCPETTRQHCTQLVASIRQDYVQHYPAADVKASERFGAAIAKALFEWSATDTVGHRAFLYNYDRQYMPPDCKGCWQQDPSVGMPALLPKWSQTRTFFTPIETVTASAPPQYAEETGSAFFSQAMEVYNVSHPVSDQNRWIAEYWSDDVPGLTFSPAARWISIAHQAIDIQSPGLAATLEIYLKTGIALNDAAVHTWYYKYKWNVERPDTYIRRLIDPRWEPLHPSPSFPSYPSGHAAFGGAASVILSDCLGQFKLTDRTHEGRKEFNGKPRTFYSFEEMAEENALSRIHMGVHYRFDCEEGLQLGRAIGRHTLQMPLWTSESLSYE
jgi:hypothetical protein